MGTLGRRAFCKAVAAVGAAAALPAKAAGGDYPAIVGRLGVHRTRRNDTLVGLARVFRLGYTELVAANPGIDPWLPGEGTEILLPTAHVVPASVRGGIVLNLADQRLYHFDPDGATVRTAPIGIGNAGWNTPTGTTKVVRKARNPTWYVPASVRREQPELPAVVRPGPDNPLGAHALYLGWPSYVIHGTNKPDGVGRRASHGCVRLYPEDVAWLHDTLPVGAPVRVVDQEVKVARRDGQLFLEVHASQTQADEIEQTGRPSPAMPAELRFKVAAAAGAAAVDWPEVARAGLERRGVPVPVLRG